jgi:hypothetical protein
MQPYEWDSLYSDALLEPDVRFRMYRIDAAIEICLRCFRDIGINSSRRREQQGLLIALGDLRLLAHLHRKYSWRQFKNNV